jgi:hypothetical protein
MFLKNDAMLRDADDNGMNGGNCAETAGFGIGGAGSEVPGKL